MPLLLGGELLLLLLLPHHHPPPRHRHPLRRPRKYLQLAVGAEVGVRVVVAVYPHLLQARKVLCWRERVGRQQ